MATGIQIRANPHLAERVKREAERRGLRTVARVAAELLAERLTQIEQETQYPPQRPAAVTAH